MPLIYFWIVEEHHPERVFRQFGMKQAPPDLVDMSVDLHRISLQGKIKRNWEQEHAIYINDRPIEGNFLPTHQHWMGTRLTLLLTWTCTEG